MATATYTPPPPPVEGTVTLQMSLSEAARLRALLVRCNGNEGNALTGLYAALDILPDVPKLSLVVASPVAAGHPYPRGEEPFQLQDRFGRGLVYTINLHSGLKFVPEVG